MGKTPKAGRDSRVASQTKNARSLLKGQKII